MSFDKDLLKKILPYFLVIVVFAVVAYAYVPEVLSGKVVNQSDISSWQGMANEIVKYNKEHPDDPTLWTNSMFSGMPATSISVNYKGDYTQPIYDLLFLGERPASYLLISLIGSFLLFLAFGANIWVAALGAVAISFCSYNMQIIQVGHNTKMVAIAFMPWVLAAVVYAYRKKSLLGAILFAVALSFQIKANHPQITYYLAIIIFGYAIAEMCGAIREKVFPKFLKTSLMLLVAGILGIATNTNHLLPTYEYAKHTMRGGSELTDDKHLQTGDGLKIDYATSWSYGIEETPNLMRPNFNGGASAGSLDQNSAVYKVMKGKYAGAEEVIQQLPLYWGPQPFTAGPMYMGAIAVFLFILGLFVIKGRYKWWLIGISVLALLLGWGSNFMVMSKLFFNYAPLYNKFRTVSMILVILQITIPVMGVLGINQLLKSPSSYNKKVLYASATSVLIIVILSIVQLIFGSFTSPADAQLPKDIADALSSDRKSLLINDAVRSSIFILLGATLLYLFTIGKLKQHISVGLLTALVIIDFWGIDKRYLNSSHFVRRNDFQNQFAERAVDKMILEDNDPDYRVLDISVNTFNDAHSSYHHKTIGGYSPAKLQRYQDLIDKYIAPEISLIAKSINETISSNQNVTINDIQHNMGYYPVLAMLNTKYIIISGENPPILYNQTLGNGWFVNNVRWAESADEEIALLGEVDPKNSVVINSKSLSSEMKDLISASVANTNEGKIDLVKYAPNSLEYKYSSSENGIALFSEVFYPEGWVATIDGSPAEIFRGNYILRGMVLPEGEHSITFRFDPPSFKEGKTISQISSIILLLSLLALLCYYPANHYYRNNHRS